MSTNDDVDKQAESFKEAGNKAMTEEAYDAAIESYTKAIQCSAKREFHANRSLAHLKAGHLSEALADGQAARDIDVSWWRAHHRIGAALEALNKMPEAVEAYRRALELNPTASGVKQHLKTLMSKMTSKRRRSSVPESGAKRENRTDDGAQPSQIVEVPPSKRASKTPEVRQASRDGDQSTTASHSLGQVVSDLERGIDLFTSELMHAKREISSVMSADPGQADSSRQAESSPLRNERSGDRDSKGAPSSPYEFLRQQMRSVIPRSHRNPADSSYPDMFGSRPSLKTSLRSLVKADMASRRRGSANSQPHSTDPKARKALLQITWDDTHVQAAWKGSHFICRNVQNDKSFDAIDYPLDTFVLDTLRGWTSMHLGRIGMPQTFKDAKPTSILYFDCDLSHEILDSVLLKAIAEFAGALVVDISQDHVEQIASMSSVSKGTCIRVLCKLLGDEPAPVILTMPYDEYRTFVEDQEQAEILVKYLSKNCAVLFLSEGPLVSAQEEAEVSHPMFAFPRMGMSLSLRPSARDPRQRRKSRRAMSKSQKSRSRSREGGDDAMGEAMSLSDHLFMTVEDLNGESSSDMSDSFSSQLALWEESIVLKSKPDASIQSLWRKRLQSDSIADRACKNEARLRKEMKEFGISCPELDMKPPTEDAVLLRKYLGHPKVTLSKSNPSCAIIALRYDLSRLPNAQNSDFHSTVSASSLIETIKNEYSITSPPAQSMPRTAAELAALASNQHEQTLVPLVVDASDVQVPWDSVGGLDSVKETLKESTVYPLKYPELYQEGSASEATKGLLLFGPPGTGKTMLAKAVATETGAAFMNIDSASISSKWYGEAEKMARAVFTLARKMAPTVVFIDEIDSLLSARDQSEKSTIASVKTTLMREWDGLGTTRDRVIVIGATNRPYSLDEAILRRMPRRIMVDIPDEAQRLSILKVGLKNNRLDDSFDMEKLAAELVDYTGSDIRELCREAAVSISNARARELEEMVVAGTPVTKELYTLRPLSMDDFTAAKKKIRPSLSKDSQMHSQIKEWNEQFGEGGDGKRHVNHMFL